MQILRYIKRRMRGGVEINCMLAALLWEGTLRAGLTRANRTSRAYVSCGGRGELKRIGVDALLDMRNNAAKFYRASLSLLSAGFHLPLHLPCNARLCMHIGD